MKKIPFTKMAGAGNDFIVMESPQGIPVKKLAIAVCDRTNGIGADGLLILERSNNADYRMRIINPDASEAEMCGNGARCMAAYIAKKYRINKLFSIETLSGIIHACVKGQTVTVQLRDPVDYKPDIPLMINGRKICVHYLDTGVPHVIIYVNNLAKIDVRSIAPFIRFHKKFQPRGTNVNFVEQINQHLVANRTYERGVENETKACGTGSVAAALVTYLKANPNVRSRKKATMKVKTQSNEILKITFDLTNQQISNVWLKGSAKLIARGEYYA